MRLMLNEPSFIIIAITCKTIPHAIITPIGTAFSLILVFNKSFSIRIHNKINKTNSFEKNKTNIWKYIAYLHSSYRENVKLNTEILLLYNLRDIPQILH